MLHKRCAVGASSGTRRASLVAPSSVRTGRESRERTLQMGNVRVALIGCGYWGPNLIRNFNEVDNANMVACSDLSLDRLNRMQKRYPGITCTQNYEDLLRDPSIDA